MYSKNIATGTKWIPVDNAYRISREKIIICSVHPVEI